MNTLQTHYEINQDYNYYNILLIVIIITITCNLTYCTFRH